MLPRPEPLPMDPFKHDRNDILAINLPKKDVDDEEPILSAAIPEFGVHVCQIFDSEQTILN